MAILQFAETMVRPFVALQTLLVIPHGETTVATPHVAPPIVLATQPVGDCLTRPGTATSTTLRLRLHSIAAHAGGHYTGELPENIHFRPEAEVTSVN